MIPLLHPIRAAVQIAAWASRPLHNRRLLSRPSMTWHAARWATIRGWSTVSSSDFLWEC